MSTTQTLDGRSILAVFAHPDDESISCGGLLAWCSHLGTQVSLLCLTHGEHGRGSKDVARTRANELQSAAQTLGISSVRLMGHEDGMLPWLSRPSLESDIETYITRTNPDVVITFDKDGIYGHPDHIAVYEMTTAAVASLGKNAPALYYVSIPPGSMRRVVSHAIRTSQQSVDEQNVTAQNSNCKDSIKQSLHTVLGIDDPDAFGAEAPKPSLIIHIGQFAKAKLAALACHRTQFENSALTYIKEEQAVNLLGIEHYRRSRTGTIGPTFLDDFGASVEPITHQPMP